MISIDHTEFLTKIPAVIDRIHQIALQANCIKKNERRWKGYVIYVFQNNVKLRFRQNRFGQYDTLIIAFSPHILFNKGLHNANNVSLSSLLLIIEELFFQLKIAPTQYEYFKISSIELGVNFESHIDPDKLISSCLMLGQQFFKRHEKFPHYIYTEDSEKEGSKYMKAKFYIKSKQIPATKKMANYELGYCPSNWMRFEIKIERPNKFRFFGFDNMENLFKTGAEELLTKFLQEQSEKLFFFDLEDIDKTAVRQGNVTLLRHYFRWKEISSFRNLTTRQRSAEKKFYNEKMPKKLDFRKTILTQIADVLKLQEN